MKLYARTTKLHNIAGRADYISNPKRQERIVATSPTVDWKPYIEHERKNQKTTEKNNEGREVMIAIPNEWLHLPPEELNHKAQSMATAAIGKSTDMQWAVHFNKAGGKDPKGNVREFDNLHLHIVFSERTRQDMGTYSRDFYLTEDGKPANRKEDRARNPDGSYKPPIHRKGDPKGDFGHKNPEYAANSWMHLLNGRIKAEFERQGVTVEPNDPIPQRHEGKGREAPEIRQTNKVVREANEVLAAPALRDDLKRKEKHTEEIKNTLYQGFGGKWSERRQAARGIIRSISDWLKSLVTPDKAGVSVLKEEKESSKPPERTEGHRIAPKPRTLPEALEDLKAAESARNRVKKTIDMTNKACFVIEDNKKRIKEHQITVDKKGDHMLNPKSFTAFGQMSKRNQKKERLEHAISMIERLKAENKEQYQWLDKTFGTRDVRQIQSKLDEESIPLNRRCKELTAECEKILGGKLPDSDMGRYAALIKHEQQNEQSGSTPDRGRAAPKKDHGAR